MMIRINLLPVRQVKKREVKRQLLTIAVVAGLATVIGNLWWYLDRSSEEERLSSDIVATSRQIAELEKAIGEVNQINIRKKEVEDKLKILGDLRKSRSGPVRMLDALATATPKKLWITEFEENTNQVKISGVGLTHDDVADFMRQLAGIVWTPKGMGRLVERKAGSENARVELLAQDGAIEDFVASEVSAFFTQIELKKAEAFEAKEGQLSVKRVTFEVNLTANYAI